jgi:hypothetical protein
MRHVMNEASLEANRAARSLVSFRAAHVAILLVVASRRRQC